MVKFYHNERKITISNPLARALQILCYNTVKSENDAIIIIDGKEGGGKSKIGRQIGAYCSYLMQSTFNINNITMNIGSYVINSINSQGERRINILDESREALNRRRAMRTFNVAFGNFLSECRILRQIHIIILPKFHDLENYVAEHRMNLLVNVMMKEEKEELFGEEKELFGDGVKLKRGLYRMFKRTPQLIHCYRTSRDKYPRANKIYYGKFTNDEPLSDEDLELYYQKKNTKLETYKATFEDDDYDNDKGGIIANEDDNKDNEQLYDGVVWTNKVVGRNWAE